MTVMEAVKGRRSVRKYRDRPVEREKLMKVLEAGRLAPSASNRQEWRYVVVTDQETRKKLAAAASDQAFVAEAAAVIVACAETNGHVMMCGQPCYPIDVAISVDHMTLIAHEEGLGTCWIGAFDPTAVKALLSVPEQIRVVALLTLGYPAESPSAGKRKRLEEIVHYENWGRSS